MGSGQIQAGETVVIDLWPRDMESFCFADMTRTFVVGEVAADVAEWHRLCKQALDRAISEIRPGADGRAIFDGTCDLFEAAGEPTQRTKQPGVPLVDGFFHGLGHGVGLEVHEEPGLGLTSKDKLQVGRRRHGRAGALPAGLRRRAARGSRARDRGRRREPDPCSPTTWRPDVAEHRQPVPRGAAVSAAGGVRGAGECGAGDLRARVSRSSGSGRVVSGCRGSSRSRRCMSGSCRMRSGIWAAS